MNGTKDLSDQLAQLASARPGLTTDQMFGGSVYRANGKICCGLIDDQLLVRVDRYRYEEVVARPHTDPLYVDDRAVPGYVLVRPEGYAEDEQLAAWFDLGLSSLHSQPVTVTVARAGFWRRWFAFSIDFVILSFVGSIISAMYGNEAVAAWLRAVAAILGFAIPIVYFVRSYSTHGQTWGKAILGVKVVSIDGSPLDWRKGILRTVGYVISTIPLDLGFYWAVWDSNKQAWHDKLAGTVVVRASVMPEQLQGTVDPAEVRRTQKRWLVRAVIPVLLVAVVGGAMFALFMQRATAEVREMGPWPGADVSASEAVALDLSHLGLSTGETLNARDHPRWSDGGYDEGILVSYESEGKLAVLIWGLQYGSWQRAESDLNSIASVAEHNCPRSTWASLPGTGIVHCQSSYSYDKVFWKDKWIVNIAALEVTEFTPAVLVDKVRDAIAAHWEEIATP